MSPVCVGCGLFVNGSGLLEVQRRPGGGIECDPDGGDAGLYVTFPAQAAPTLSPDAGNGLDPRANGLFAYCPDSIVGAVNMFHTGTTLPVAINIGGGPTATFDILNICETTPTSDCGGAGSSWRIQNTLDCTVGGFVSVQAYGGELTDESTGFACTYQLDVSVDGGSYGTSPATIVNVYNDGAINRRHHMSNLQDLNYHALAPDAYLTLTARFRIVVSAGTAVWANVPRFEFLWNFTQTGCC